MLGGFVGEEKRIKLKGFAVVLQVPFLDNPLEGGACGGEKLTKDGLGGFLYHGWR